MADSEYCTYEEFGVQFFRHAVSEERVLAGVSQLAGQPIEFGPTGVGPGRLVKLTASGRIGEARSTPVAADLVTLEVVLPVSLDFAINLQLETQRFHADVTIPLTLTARAVPPVTVHIDVEPPHSRDIGLELAADGLRASLLQRVAGIEGEVKRFIAKYVAREIAKPHIMKARTIDVAAAIDGAIGAMAIMAAQPPR